MDTETHHHHKGGDDMASQQQQQHQHQQELAASGPRRSITRELPASESDHPPHLSEHLATSTDTALPRHPFSDESPEITRDVRVAAPNSETAAERSPSLGKEAKRSTSVASRRADHGLTANGVGEGACAAGAVTATNEPPSNVDPDLQARAASVEEELVQMATVGKEEERTFLFFFFFLYNPSPSNLVHEVIDTALLFGLRTQMAASAESYRKSKSAVLRWREPLCTSRFKN